MSDTTIFLMIGGPLHGLRMRCATKYVRTVPPRPLPSCCQGAVPVPESGMPVIEYQRVDGIPGVMAPVGTAPALVLDMLVDGFGAKVPRGWDKV